MDSDTDRDPMDSTDLILRMLGDMKTDMQHGFSGLGDRLDLLNGRIAAGEQNIATLHERTKSMVCATHAAVLGQIDADIKSLKDAPVQSKAKAAAFTAGVVAAVMTVIEGVATWMRAQ